jgi:hypothetical protein
LKTDHREKRKISKGWRGKAVVMVNNLLLWRGENMVKVNMKVILRVNFALEQTTKAQGDRCIDLLFL